MTQPLWQNLSDLTMLGELDHTLAEFGQRLEARATSTELEATLLQIMVGDEAGDEHRLIASGLRRSASRLVEARVDVRVRIRDVQAGGS